MVQTRGTKSPTIKLIFDAKIKVVYFGRIYSLNVNLIKRVSHRNMDRAKQRFTSWRIPFSRYLYDGIRHDAVVVGRHKGVDSWWSRWSPVARSRIYYDKRGRSAFPLNGVTNDEDKSQEMQTTLLRRLNEAPLRRFSWTPFDVDKNGRKKGRATSQRTEWHCAGESWVKWHSR